MEDRVQPPSTEVLPNAHRAPEPCDGDDDCLLRLAAFPPTLQACGSCHETSIYVHENGCECFGCNEDVCAHCHQHTEVRWGNNEATCEACVEDCLPSEGVFWHVLPDDTVKLLCPLLLRGCVFAKDDCPRKKSWCDGCHNTAYSRFGEGCANCPRDVCDICHTHPFEELDDTPTEVGENDLWCGKCTRAWTKKHLPSVGDDVDADDDDDDVSGDDGGGDDDDDERYKYACRCALFEPTSKARICGSCDNSSMYVVHDGCECFGCDADMCVFCHSHPNATGRAPGPAMANDDAFCDRCCYECDDEEKNYWHPVPDLDTPPASPPQSQPEPSTSTTERTTTIPRSVGADNDADDDEDDEFELPEDTCEDLGSDCLLYEPEEPVTNRSCGACGRVSEYVFRAGCECSGCKSDVCVYCHGHPDTRYSSGSVPGGGETDDAMCERCCNECDPEGGVFWHPVFDTGPPSLSPPPQPLPPPARQQQEGTATTPTTKKRRREVAVKVEGVESVIPPLEEAAPPPTADQSSSRRVASKKTRSSDVHGVVATVDASASSGDASASSAAEEAMAMSSGVKVEVRRRVVDDPAPVLSLAATPYAAPALPESKPTPRKFMPPLAHPDDPLEMSVQNLVFTGVLGTSVRLPRVVQRLAYQGAELNQKRFSAVIMRLHLSIRPNEPTDLMLKQLEPLELERPRLDKIAVLIFRNGNLVCTGAKTFAHARYMLLKTAESLRRIGYGAARIVRMNVRNMVGRAQLPCRIDRARMARELSAYVNYDPEQFPGAVVRHPMTRPVTLLVFESGRVVVTGTKCKARADAALARIKPLLVHFDVNTPPGTPMPIIVWRDEVRDRTLYDLLVVHPDANMKEIRAAFRTRARLLHPDKNSHLKAGSVAFRRNESLYQRVSRAYDILNDPEHRDLYDRTGEGRDTGPDSDDDNDDDGGGDDDDEHGQDADDEASQHSAGGEAPPVSSRAARPDEAESTDDEDDVDDEDLAMVLEELMQEPGDD